MSIEWIGKRQRGQEDKSVREEAICSCRGSSLEGTEAEGEFQLQVGTCCQRNALHFCYYIAAEWHTDSSVSWRGAPVLKMHFWSLLVVGDSDARGGGDFLSVKKKWCPHICRDAYVKHPKKVGGWGCWYSFICLFHLEVFKSSVCYYVDTTAHLPWSLWSSALVLRAREKWICTGTGEEVVCIPNKLPIHVSCGRTTWDNSVLKENKWHFSS